MCCSDRLNSPPRGVEQAHSYAFKAVITVIVTGFVVAVWLGIKTTLGK